MHINNFLIEFTIEDNEQIQKVMDAYLNNKSVSEKDFFGHYLNEIEQLINVNSKCENNC